MRNSWTNLEGGAFTIHNDEKREREREQVTRGVIKFGYTFPIDLDDEEEAALSRHFSLWMGGFKWNSKSTKK